MGEVFFGRSRAGRPVAVKLIYPVFADDAEFRRRFRLEVEAGRKVGGFHAAQVVDADPDAERPWMVTAFVAGPSLDRILTEHQALPLDRVRVLGAGVAEALGAIHAAGLIHRDLKPSNILLAEDGPHVIDFGVARAIDGSGVTARSGTPGFMAPEVLLGQPLTSACDVFALGMVLAYAAGIRPFGLGLAEVIAYRVVHEEPDLGGLDPQIRDVVAACLAKEPSERPTPARILELLADPDPPGQWLPPPLQTMITADEPPGKSTAAAATDLARAARLLEQAEQIARALPLDEQAMAPEDRVAAIPGPPPPPASSSARARGLDEQYDRALPLAVQRARALVHVARSPPAPTLLTPHNCWTRRCTRAGTRASRRLRATITSWRPWPGTPHRSSACSWPASIHRPHSDWWLTSSNPLRHPGAEPPRIPRRCCTVHHEGCRGGS